MRGKKTRASYPNIAFQHRLTVECALSINASLVQNLIDFVVELADMIRCCVGGELCRGHASASKVSLRLDPALESFDHVVGIHSLLRCSPLEL